MPPATPQNNEPIEPDGALLANCVQKADRFGKLALMRETWDRRRFAGNVSSWQILLI
jgi:hypothetical protein